MNLLRKYYDKESTGGGIPDEVKQKSQKPVKAKPVFYAVCYEPLKVIAKEMGYNLLINGSLNRDMDLVAVAWVDEPRPMIDVVIAFDRYLRGVQYTEESAMSGYLHNILPGGRNSFAINLNRGGRWNQYIDEEWYLDISFSKINESEEISRLKAENERLRGEGWISLDERKPTMQKTVLFYFPEYRNISTGYFSKYENKVRIDNENIIGTATHWMHLPPSPTTKK